MEENYLQNLISAFTHLPGVGFKTAQRYAYKILDMDEEEVKNMTNAIILGKKNIKFCKKCGGYSVDDLCNICKNRKSKIICVVKDPKDIMVMEKLGNDYLYHALHGVWDPMNSVGPEDLRIKELLERVNNEDIEEVIIATNPDIKGEATAMYIAKLLKPFNIKVTRIAQGLSMGSDLEYADEITLEKALESRREL